MDTLPTEILMYIFQQIPYKNQNWMSILLVCKRFFEIGTEAFDPSINMNAPLRRSCEHGKIGKLIFADEF